MEQKIKIGVLGGIGPEATGKFYLKLIEELQIQDLIKTNADYPQILVNSIPAPELVSENIDEKDLVPYLEGLKELDNCDSLNFIIMVCNTIHLFHERLQKEIKTELLDLRKEVLNKLERSNYKKIAILGTSSTVSLGLYQFEGIEYYNPTPEELNILGEAVFLFNKGVEKEKQIEKVLNVAQNCLAKEAQTILLACTELTVMLEGTSVPSLNTTDILVEAVIERYKNLRQKENNEPGGN